jgi:cytochrome c oxidase assembly factor CtaG
MTPWTWTWDPLLIAPIAALLALYAAGAARLRRTAGGLRLVRGWHLVAFGAGWTAFVVAMLSPLHAASAVFLSAHMTQHELLMVVAAPLLVLARPLIVCLWGLDARSRELIGALAHARPVAASWGGLTDPMPAWMLHALALWIWHLPSLYQAALASQALHAVQHVCFLGTALLFWFALVHGRGGRIGYGAAVLYLFTTAVHTGALGALLTFSSSPWYRIHAEATRAWGVDPLGDQQLAGLIMWVPCSATYLVVGLALLAAWLSEGDRRLAHASEGLAAATGSTTHER